jgi:hypothetical protein
MSTVTGGQGNIVTNGLVLNLDAANPRSYPQPYNGTTWQNIAPVSSSLTGSLVNGVGYTGSNGGSIVFDGVDDYVTSPSVISGFTDYSAEFWFKLTTNPTGSEKWLGSQYGGSGIGRVIFMIFTTNKLRNFINGTGFDGSTTILTDTWYHAVFTRNAVGSGTIYLNGVLDGSGTLSTINVLDRPFQIGGATSIASRWLNGQIPISRLYNRALSASEVLQNFNATRARFGI